MKQLKMHSPCLELNWFVWIEAFEFQAYLMISKSNVTGEYRSHPVAAQLHIYAMS